jgi:hypothetical protein
MGGLRERPGIKQKITERTEEAENRKTKGLTADFADRRGF